MKSKCFLLAAFLLINLLVACVRPQTNTQDQFWAPSNETATQSLPGIQLQPSPTANSNVPPAPSPNVSFSAPTPDLPHVVPTLRANSVNYVVEAGDSLAVIARRYGVDVTTIANTNQISNPDLLKIGQALVIPPPSPTLKAPDFKIIPDSELVLSPLTKGFDLAGFIHSKNGYLDGYSEKVDNDLMTGVEIVDRVSREHSVNPRILLTVLEFQGGWVMSKNPPSQYIDYPMGFFDRSRQGLYKQLFWAANMLDQGFYGWQQEQFGDWILVDGTVTLVSPAVNSGTAAVQYLMGLLRGQDTWLNSVSQNGVYAAYNNLFGNPFNYTFWPIVPDGLSQPTLQLPFENNVQWYFTGGPHMGWDTGSPWAALDFAPEDASNCNISATWETAVADGVIARSGNGSVVLDLDGDGYEQTGWTILYLHVSDQDRIAAGTKVHAGDHIGHASCEGGYAPETHLHIARRYNGMWILADGPIPFVMDGWVPESTGVEYDGNLKKNGQVVEAWNSRKDENKIQR
ncbi:MAG TPA: LysM peptidoglycan-binding domain-containing protein [Anaerolineaceae bacterium]